MHESEANQIKAELSAGLFSQVYSRETTLGKVTRRKVLPGDKLNLLALNTKVRVFDLPTSLIYCVDFPEVVFYGNRLIDLLNQARKREGLPEPAGYRLGLYGTLDDWVMIRNRRYNLYDLHTEGLGNSFIKFSEKDLQTYIYAAHPIKKTSAEEFMESVLKKLLTQHMAERWMRRAEQDCQNSLLYVSTVSTQNRTMSLDSTKIPFADLPTDSKAVVIQAARKTSIKDQIIIDPQTQPSVILEEENPYDRYSSYRISHLGKGFVEIIYGKSFVRLNLSGEWRRRVSYYAADESEYYLSPLQVWAKSKTSGERFWLDEDLSTDLMEGVDTRANHRLGLILATTISDKERELLPYRLPLKPGGNMQYLKEAQMPVLPFLTVNDIRNLVGEDPQELIMDPHQTILNGAYFNAVERSVHFN